MFSGRQHLAFCSRSVQLIAGRLGKLLNVSPAALPCKNRSVFERRLRSKWRRCLRVEDFEQDVSCDADRRAVSDILKLYSSFSMAPLWLEKEHVIELIPYKTPSRKRHMTYLFRKERDNTMNKHESYHYHRHKRAKIPHLGQIFDESGHLLYGMYNNTFISYVDVMKNKDDMGRLVHASAFEQPLVIDFSYNHLMRVRQFSSLANQIILMHVHNRKTHYPFDMVFANYSCNLKFEEMFNRMCNSTAEKLLISVHKESVDQLFPIDRMIYMSPHSPEVMKHFDPDAIYVLGGLVDTYRPDRKDNSFVRASASKIRTQRLPVLVKERNNEPPLLTLSSVACMLIDMKNEGIGVEEALDRHISVKKLRAPAHILLEQRRKQQSQSDPSISDSVTTEQVEQMLMIKSF
jgi:hypothetical protein